MVKGEWPLDPSKCLRLTGVTLNALGKATALSAVSPARNGSSGIDFYDIGRMSPGCLVAYR